MEDNFKNALKKAREQLEQDKPSPEVWEKLRSKLEVNQQPKKLSIAARYKYKFAAAAGIILLVLGYIFYKNDLKSIPESASADQHSNISNTSSIYDRYQQTVLVYKNQVAEQEKKIEVFLIGEPALRIELDQGVNELREIFSDLEEKLAGEIGKEQILQMMVSNLRLQEKVINNQLALLQHLKKEKDEEL
ncbi:hypothetical protein [Flavitalea sp.]|nr:hypothetical protein [Flavitalea sp.]